MARGENTAYHPNRKVGRFASLLGPRKSEWAGLLEEEPTTNTPNDWANPHGIPRPALGKYKDK